MSESDTINSRTTTKRMKMIFSVMTSPNRVEILRILNSRGPSSYSELKENAGFITKKDSGKFAYHLRRLVKHGLVLLNKSERHYSIMNMGKLVLNLARQIESRSLVESGKLSVRVSSMESDDYSTYKIVQSLIREGNLPMDLAQKIAEEVEHKIYRSNITYLTGALIRDMTNNVLLEGGHEEHRNKLARLGVPTYDMVQTFLNLDDVNGGAQEILMSAGRRVLTEHVMLNVLTRQVADMHLSGDIHISNLGTWSMLPDILFVDIAELLEDGMVIGGKHAATSRISKPEQPADAVSLLSIMIPLLSREASGEVVIDGLPQFLAKSDRARPDEDVEQDVLGMLMLTSVQSVGSSIISIRLDLGTDAGMVNPIMRAYKTYARRTPRPRIGLIINHEGGGGMEAVSEEASEIILLGGRIYFTRTRLVSSRGIVGVDRDKSAISMVLQSVSINLPRLALDSQKDYDYFRARLVLLMNTVIDALIRCKARMIDLARRGLSPVIARNTKYVERLASLTINLVGLREAVFDLLGYSYNKDGRNAVQTIIDTAVEHGAARAKETGEHIKICIADSEGSARFLDLDRKRYGKKMINAGDLGFYSQGMIFAMSNIDSYAPNSIPVSLTNRINRCLNAGLQVKLQIDRDVNDSQKIKKSLEKMATLMPSFVPEKEIVVCDKCGFKGEPFEARCPKCDAP